MLCSLLHEDPGVCASAIIERLDADVASLHDLLEGVVFVDVKMVAHLDGVEHVKVASHLDLLGRDISKLFIGHHHAHSVVNVAPLGGLAHLGAVVRVPVDKVRGFFEIIKREFFGNSSVLLLQDQTS